MTPDDIRALADRELKNMEQACASGDKSRAEAIMLAIPAIQLKFLAEIAAQLIEMNIFIEQMAERVRNLDQKI